MPPKGSEGRPWSDDSISSYSDGVRSVTGLTLLLPEDRLIAQTIPERIGGELFSIKVGNAVPFAIFLIIKGIVAIPWALIIVMKGRILLDG